MEADHLRLELLDQVAERRIERRAIAHGHRRGGIDAELAIVGRQRLAPARFTLVVGHRRRMTEEAEVDRLLRAGADLAHLLADLSALSMAHGSDPSAPASAAAAASSQSMAPAIGACTMGNSMSRSSMRLLLGHMSAQFSVIHYRICFTFPAAAP